MNSLVQETDLAYKYLIWKMEFKVKIKRIFRETLKKTLQNLCKVNRMRRKA